jgi:hypothetical protein
VDNHRECPLTVHRGVDPVASLPPPFREWEGVGGGGGGPNVPLLHEVGVSKNESTQSVPNLMGIIHERLKFGEWLRYCI